MRWNIPDTQREKGKIQAACMCPPGTLKDSNITYYIMITVTARLFFNLPNRLLAPQEQGLCIIFKFFKKFIYFWLCWVFSAASSLSLAVGSGGHSLVAVHRLLTAVTSLVEHRL